MKKLFVFLALIAFIFSETCEECEKNCKEKYKNSQEKTKECFIRDCIVKGIC